MADVIIKVLDDGPFIVTGSPELLDGAGARFEKQEQIALCRCGASKNKPFCDGSHKAAGFTSSVRVGGNR